MAYQYRGLGSPVQTDTSGYTIINNALANIRDHNPIQALNNLIGNYEYTQARNAVLNSANPYDGLTTYQKLQQLGLSNNYIADRLNDLEAVNNAEVSNIKAARQAASDFNTEALLAEAYRVRASGDPAQIAAFNNKLARNMGMWVASGAVTTDTAKQLYTDENSVKQAVADIGLTKGQTAQAYGAARQANAGALLNELAANDKLAEQYSLADFKTLISIPNHPVTDLDSALALGRALGWSDGRTHAAWNAGKIPNYQAQWGGVTTDLGTISANIPNYGASLASAPNSSPNQGTPTKQSSPAYTAKSLAEASQATSNPNAVTETVTSGEPLPSNTNQAGNTGATGGTINNKPKATASNLVQQQAGTAPVTSTTGASPATQASTGTQAAPTTVPNQSTANVNNNIPAPETAVTPSTKATPEALQDTATAAQQTNTNTTNVQQNQEANNLNNIVNENVKTAGGGVVKVDNSTGKSYFDIGSNALLNNKTGTWDFNKNVPLDQTNLFDIESTDEKLRNINRDLGGNGIVNRLWSLDYDSSSGTISWVPTKEQLDYIAAHPESENAFRNIEAKMTEAIKPLLTPENLAGGLSYLSAAFGNSKEGREANFNQLKSLLQASNSQKLSDDVSQTLENILQLGKAPETLNNIAATDITRLYNVANNGTPKNMLETLANAGIDKTAAAVSMAVAQGNNSAEVIQQSIDNAKSQIASMDNIEDLKNLINKTGGSLTKAVAAMMIGDNATNPEYQAIIKSLTDNGVIVPINQDGKQSAENIVDLIEKNQETSGEFFTALEEYTQYLMDKSGLPDDYAKASALYSSVIGGRGFWNSLINTLSDTNNMQVINEQYGYNSAEQIKSWLIDPRGRNRLNEYKQVLSNAELALADFVAKGDSLNTAMTNLNGDVTALGADFDINIKQLPDGTEYRYVIPRTEAGTNSLKSGKGVPRNFIKNARDANKAFELYKNSANTLRVYGGALLHTDLINKNLDQFSQNMERGFGFLNENKNSTKVQNNIPSNAWIASHTLYASNAFYTKGNSINNSKDFQNNLKKFYPKEPSDKPIATAIDLFNTSNSTKENINNISSEINNTNNEASQNIFWQDMLSKRNGNIKFTHNTLQNPSPEVLENLTKFAEDGNSESQYKLGLLYSDGTGVERDETKAFEWFKKAADQGNTNAMLLVAYAYRTGRGVDMDIEKSKYWTRKLGEKYKNHIKSYSNTYIK